MRILLVNSWYYPNMHGGAEQSTKLLAENLSKMGETVAVLSGDGSIEEDGNVQGIYIYRAKTLLTSKPQFLFQKVIIKDKDIVNKRVKRYFLNVCDSFRPDVIHTNSLSGLSFYIWKLAHEQGIPVVHTIRDYSVYSPRGVYEQPSQATPLYRLYLTYRKHRCRKLSEYVDYVTAPSEFTLQTVCNDGFFSRAKKECIVNSVELNLNEVKERIEERRTSAKLTQTIIYAGRLLKIKGIELLINTFMRIEDPSIKLIICGKGKLAEYVKEAVQKDGRIEYCGHLSQNELNIKYKEASFAVIPSLWDEPFGRVIIEANQYGLPVLASNRGGIPEIVNTIKGGILFDDNSEQDFTNKLNQMLYMNNYNDFYNNIIDNIMDYSIEKQISRFRDIYKGLCSSEIR